MDGQQLILHFFLVIIATMTFANTSRLDVLKARKPPVIRNEKIGATWTNGIIPYFLDSKSYDIVTRQVSRVPDGKLHTERARGSVLRSSPSDIRWSISLPDHVIAMRVRMTMNTLEGVSCIRFKPIIGAADSNTTWLHITNPTMERECVHTPRHDKSGKVILVLGLDCLSEQQILHTLMHGIGFKDEVTHPQRDQYIRILWNNIQPAYHDLFRVQADDGMSKTLAEYDPMSVMQFHDRAFSLNGHASIAPLIPGLVINPSDGLSQLDAMKLRLLFGQECKRRNVDDLLDMCKTIFREEFEQNYPSRPSKSIANEETVKQEGVTNNGGNNQTSDNVQNEDVEKFNDDTKDISDNEGENDNVSKDEEI